MKNPTLIVITDRNDLDDQLFGTFSACHELLRQKPVQAEDRGDLQEKLKVVSGGVVFTTLQKFIPDENASYPMLTDRRNVIVIADEAHRSQYGLKARVVNPRTRTRPHRLRIRQAPARRRARGVVHRLHRHADRARRQEHARGVRRVHRRV